MLSYWDFLTRPSLEFTENGMKKKAQNQNQNPQRRIATLFPANRKAKVTTLVYNQGTMQKSVSECTTFRYRRRPHWVSQKRGNCDSDSPERNVASCDELLDQSSA